MTILGEEVIATFFLCVLQFMWEWHREKKFWFGTERENSNFVVVQVLSYNTVYSFLPERYPHKPYVKDDYPRNVTTLVNTTVKFECPTYSDLEPHIQWIKMPHMFEEGIDSVDDNYTIPIQVRGAGSRGTCTPTCWITILNLLKKCVLEIYIFFLKEIFCLVNSSKER